MNQNEKFIRETIRLAEISKQKGNHPFGALLVKNQEILLTAENTVTTENDCTRHAELNLVSQAARSLGPKELFDSVLYSSTEPCPMCAGAIYWAGIRKVIFGCPTKRLAELAGGGLAIPCSEILAQGSETTEVLGPILEKEAVQVHHGFWENLGR